MHEDEVLGNEAREDNDAPPAESAADGGGEPDGGGEGQDEDEALSPDEDSSDDEGASRDEAASSDPLARITGLEAAVSERDGEIAALKESVVGLEGRLATAVDLLTEAVASYRAALVRANPDVVEGQIMGETIVAIDESLATARHVIDRVKRGLEEETALARVPAGAPERRTPDLSALSSREKIRYAIGGNR